jgi:hypothetical protein
MGYQRVKQILQTRGRALPMATQDQDLPIASPQWVKQRWKNIDQLLTAMDDFMQQGIPIISTDPGGVCSGFLLTMG